jgi:hypothetical protein
VRFFVGHADVVRLASFQLQADTGGERCGARQQPIDIGTVSAQIRAGAGRRSISTRRSRAMRSATAMR